MVRLAEPSTGSKALFRTFRGFSLTELLVALGIIAVLAGLLLPAVQASREQARQTLCSARLRDLSLATLAREAAIGAFPITANVEYNSRSGATHPSVSPHVALLPYLDQAAVATRCNDLVGQQVIRDFSGLPLASASVGIRTLGDDPELFDLLTTPLAAFRCPSDFARSARNNYRANLGVGPRVFSRRRIGHLADDFAGSGPFVQGEAIRLSEVVDGASCTILFSERQAGDDDSQTFNPLTDAIALGFWPGDADAFRRACAQPPPTVHWNESYGGTTWFLGGFKQTWYNHVARPNSGIDCESNGHSVGGGLGVWAARSYHRGGVQAAFADGHVRFIADQTDLAVWRAMGTIAGSRFRVAEQIIEFH